MLKLVGHVRSKFTRYSTRFPNSKQHQMITLFCFTCFQSQHECEFMHLCASCFKVGKVKVHTCIPSKIQIRNALRVPLIFGRIWIFVVLK